MESQPNNTMRSERFSICSRGILRSVKISVWRLQGFIVLILLYKASPSGTAHGRPPYRHCCNRLFLVKYSRFLCNAFTYTMDTYYCTPSTVQLHCRFPPKMHKRRKWQISTWWLSYSVILQYPTSDLEVTVLITKMVIRRGSSLRPVTHYRKVDRKSDSSRSGRYSRYRRISPYKRKSSYAPHNRFNYINSVTTYLLVQAQFITV